MEERLAARVHRYNKHLAVWHARKLIKSWSEGGVVGAGGDGDGGEGGGGGSEDWGFFTALEARRVFAWLGAGTG